MQAAAIEARGPERVQPPGIAMAPVREAAPEPPTPQVQDPLFEDAWFSRGETELAVQVVAIDRDPTDEMYLPEVRSYRMPITVGVMLTSAVAALLVMF